MYHSSLKFSTYANRFCKGVSFKRKLSLSKMIYLLAAPVEAKSEKSKFSSPPKTASQVQTKRKHSLLYKLKSAFVSSITASPTADSQISMQPIGSNGFDYLSSLRDLRKDGISAIIQAVTPYVGFKFYYQISKHKVPQAEIFPFLRHSNVMLIASLIFGIARVSSFLFTDVLNQIEVVEVCNQEVLQRDDHGKILPSLMVGDHLQEVNGRKVQNMKLSSVAKLLNEGEVGVLAEL